ncbi:hypothetical protein EP331_00390 [bacterium]|nr:MAG: hypothetical protein EP331_00390 [bacterium]
MAEHEIKSSSLSIPDIKLNKISFTDNTSTKDYFIGIDDISLKEQSINKLKDLISQDGKIVILHDFRYGVEIGYRKWTYTEDVNIYENTRRTDINSLVEGSSGTYECILWIRVLKY